MLALDVAPMAAQTPDRARSAAPAAAPEKHGGASVAEKLACAYLLIGGSVMLYYGPREKENGRLTMDGKSEAVAGAGAIVLSVALLRDILKKRSRSARR